MRGNLLTQDAEPFRRRNPRVSRALTSRLAPAVGASLAGFTLCAYPADQFRLTVAIYMASRAAEFVYNALEDEGYFKDMPWLTSALLMPPVYGQLLHAFLFDRDCFPAVSVLLPRDSHADPASLLATSFSASATHTSSLDRRIYPSQ
jgi:hypothetical protein